VSDLPEVLKQGGHEDEHLALLRSLERRRLVVCVGAGASPPSTLIEGVGSVAVMLADREASPAALPGEAAWSDLLVFGSHRFPLSWAAAVTGRPPEALRDHLASWSRAGAAVLLPPPRAEQAAGADPDDPGDARLSPGAVRWGAGQRARADARARMIEAAAGAASALRGLPPEQRRARIARHGGLWRGLLLHLARTVEAALGLTEIADHPDAVERVTRPVAAAVLADLPEARALVAIAGSLGADVDGRAAPAWLLPAYTAAAALEFPAAVVGGLAGRLGICLLPDLARALPWLTSAAELFHGGGLPAASAAMLDASAGPLGGLGRMRDCAQATALSLSRSFGACEPWLIAARQCNVVVAELLAAGVADAPRVQAWIDQLAEARARITADPAPQSGYVRALADSAAATLASVARPAASTPGSGDAWLASANAGLAALGTPATALLARSSLVAATGDGTHLRALQQQLRALLASARSLDADALFSLGALVDQQLSLQTWLREGRPASARSRLAFGRIAAVATLVPGGGRYRFGVLYLPDGISRALPGALLTTAAESLAEVLGPGHALVSDLLSLARSPLCPP